MVIVKSFRMAARLSIDQSDTIDIVRRGPVRILLDQDLCETIRGVEHKLGLLIARLPANQVVFGIVLIRVAACTKVPLGNNLNTFRIRLGSLHDFARAWGISPL